MTQHSKDVSVATSLTTGIHNHIQYIMTMLALL